MHEDTPPQTLGVLKAKKHAMNGLKTLGTRLNREQPMYGPEVTRVSELLTAQWSCLKQCGVAIDEESPQRATGCRAAQGMPTPHGNFKERLD